MNYQQEMEHLVAQLEGGKPTLLLHSCCAPCSSSVLETLCRHFTVTIDYYNPNIYPPAEYARREAEQQRFVQEVYGTAVDVRASAYDPPAFYSAVRGLEEIPEGGARCFACYRLRLAHTAALAARDGFAFFTSTLSVSPHKNAAKLNELGAALAQEYAHTGLRFLPSDFKKKDGFKRSTALAAQHGLYRQEYCGCVFSLRERGLSEDAPV